MKGIVEERAIGLGEYIIESKATVRKAAKKFGVSKSTVHTVPSKTTQSGLHAGGLAFILRVIN